MVLFTFYLYKVSSKIFVSKIKYYGVSIQMHFLQQCFQLVLLAFQHFTHLLTEIWNLFLVLPLATAGSARVSLN